MVGKPVLITITVGVFFAGLGIGLAIPYNNHPFYSMNQSQMQQMMNNPNPTKEKTTADTQMGTGMGENMMIQRGDFKSISKDDAISLMKNLPGAKISDDGTITFDSPNVNLTVLAMMNMEAGDLVGNSSMAGEADYDVFVIDTMINPTLVVNRGTALQVTIVNMDEDMGHNFVVTTTEPPYPVTPMKSNMGEGSKFLNSMPVIPTLQDEKAYEETTTLTLKDPGTYYYICTYPGHAAEGMYGKIVVK